MENSEYIGRHTKLDENNEPVVSADSEYEPKHAKADNPWEDLAENPPVFAGEQQPEPIQEDTQTEEESEFEERVVDNPFADNYGETIRVAKAKPVEEEQSFGNPFTDEVNTLAESLDEPEATAFKTETLAQEQPEQKSVEEPFEEKEQEEETEEKNPEEEEEKAETLLSPKELEGVIDTLDSFKRQIEQIYEVVSSSKKLVESLDDIDHMRRKMILNTESTIEDIKRGGEGIAQVEEDYIVGTKRGCDNVLELCGVLSRNASLLSPEAAMEIVPSLRAITEQTEELQDHLVSKLRSR